MEKIIAVGVKELKNNLSAMLKEVQRGVRILVTDRNRVVAELREPSLASALEVENPLLAEAVREGKIKLPTQPNKGSYPKIHPGIRFPEGTAMRLLNEDRDEE